MIPLTIGLFTNCYIRLDEKKLLVYITKKNTSLDIVEIIYLIAISFALSSALLIQFKIRTEHPILMGYLSGYLLVLGLSNLMLLFIMTGWMLNFPHLFKTLMPLSFLAPVFSYFYVKGSLGQSYIPHKWGWLHYSPFFLILLHYLPFILKSSEEKVMIVSSVIQNNHNVVDYSYGWIFKESHVFVFRTIHTIVYLIFCWKLIIDSKLTQPFIHKQPRLIIKWLRFFVFGMTAYHLAIVGCYVLLELNFYREGVNELFESSVFILTALLVFILSSYLLFNPKLILSLHKPLELMDTGSTQSFSDIVEKIEKKELYRNSDLTLGELIAFLDISNEEFSTLIKLNGYRNFNDLINSQRLDCFLRKASNVNLKKNTIEGIAKDCGFKSSATFYRVFKNKYEKTPKQFLKDASF